MLNLLAFGTPKIPLGASILDTCNVFKNLFLQNGYQVIADGTQMQWTNCFGNMGTVANAFIEDGDATLAAVDWVAMPHYLGLTFDEPKLIGSFCIQPGGDLTRAPLTWDLQYCDDITTNQTWVTQQSYTMALAQWRPRYRHMFTVDAPTSHVSWRLKVNTTTQNTCTYIGEFTLFDTAGNPTCKSDKAFFDLIPPVGQEIGNENSYEYIRLQFNANTIRYRTFMRNRIDRPQCFMIYMDKAGANPYKVSINGQICQQDPTTATSNSTAIDNLTNLYIALKASVDPIVSGYKYEFIAAPVMNGDEGNVIRATCKTTKDLPDTIITTNCRTTSLGPPIPAGYDTISNGHYDASWYDFGMQDGADMYLTTDLVNGFVYMFSIYERGFTLATKTNVDYYGPITVEWADNEKAKACLPQPLTRYVSPCELFIIGNGNASGVGASSWDSNKCRPAHVLAVPNTHGSNTGFECAYNQRWLDPFQKARLRGVIRDAQISSPWGSYSNVLSSSGIWAGGSTGTIGDDFQIHRLTMLNSAITSNDYNSTVILPAVPLQYHHMVAGTITNEQLLLVSHNTIAAYLVTPLDGTTDFLEITLTDTSLLASSGYIVIDANGIQEIVQYTSKNDASNKLLGCSRNKYNSKRNPHWAGDEVRQALWFCKINNAALFCGFNNPS